MTSPAAEPAPSETEDDDEFIWRLSKETMDGKVTLSLGDQLSDLPDAQLTFFMHRLGESLIKMGTQFLQSRISDDDEDDYDEDYD